MKKSVLLFLAGSALTVVVAAPAGCFFPDYTFNGNAGGAGGDGNGGPGAGASTASSQGGNTGGGGNGAGGCTCAEPPPQGWQGYFTIFDGDPGQDPGCPSEYPTQAPKNFGREIVAPPADCSSYKCTEPTGGTCGATITAFTFTDAKCGHAGTCVPQDPPAVGAPDGKCFEDFYYPGMVSTCGPPTDPNDHACMTGTQDCNQSVSVATIPATGGSCATCSGTPKTDDVTFSKLGRSCEDPKPVAGAQCNPGQTCLPNPADVYSGVCIRQLGDITCPLSKFSVKHTFFQDHSDDRGCSDCQCGSASGQTCDFTLEIFQADCGANNARPIGTPTATLHGGDCADLSPTNTDIRGRVLSDVQAPSGGKCSHTGGEPTGSAEGTMPITFCCTK